ncbi:hypothetical protein O0L34_g16710 [Tuta absoluta]|nr:hypothetical protein O0L34_g16710 [Tuta absoluta]
MLSEQAGEARNKFWRYDREHHSRKIDRLKTMQDLFLRAMESSDPVISDIRLSRRKRNMQKLPLPGNVVNLLKVETFGYDDKEDEQLSEFVEEQIIEDHHTNAESVALTAENELFSDE